MAAQDCSARRERRLGRDIGASRHDQVRSPTQDQAESLRRPPTFTLIGRFSSIRRACNSETVRSSFSSTGVGVAGAPPNSSKMISPACLSLDSAGPRSSFLKVKRLRLGAGEVVPCVLPAKSRSGARRGLPAQGPPRHRRWTSSSVSRRWARLVFGPQIQAPPAGAHGAEVVGLIRNDVHADNRRTPMANLPATPDRQQRLQPIGTSQAYSEWWRRLQDQWPLPGP